MTFHHVVSVACWQIGLPSVTGHGPFRVDASLSLSRWWCSVAKSSLTLCDLSFTISLSLLKFMFIEMVMLSNHLILCHPLFLLPLIFPSSWVFSNESILHQVAMVLELQLQYQSFQWIFKVDFFRIDWFDLLAVQGTLKHLFEYRSSKASILQHSAFLMIQHSHPYMTTGKTITLTIWTFC